MCLILYKKTDRTNKTYHFVKRTGQEKTFWNVKLINHDNSTTYQVWVFFLRTLLPESLDNRVELFQKPTQDMWLCSLKFFSNAILMRGSFPPWRRQLSYTKLSIFEWKFFGISALRTINFRLNLQARLYRNISYYHIYIF